MEDLIGVGIVGFILAFFAVFVVLFIVGIVLYILQAIGLFAIAKKEGRQDVAFLAWIPIANSFLMALLVEDDVHPDIRGKFTLIYGIAFVVSILLSSFIPFVGFIPLILMLYAFYIIVKWYSPNPILHIVIAAITLGASSAVSIFLLRKRDRIIEVQNS